MKISIELIAEALNQNNLEEGVISKVMNDVSRMAQIQAAEEQSQRHPTVKKQFVILLSDPRGEIKGDFVGWALQIPVDDNPASVVESIKRAAYEFNVSKRGRKYPVKSIGEACEAVSARFTKDQGLSIKTRLPVQVVITDNILPEEA